MTLSSITQWVSQASSSFARVNSHAQRLGQLAQAAWPAENIFRLAAKTFSELTQGANALRRSLCADGKAISGKSLPVIRLSPNEVNSYRLTFLDQGSGGAVKTQAHDTKTGRKIEVVIPNPDAPAGSSGATYTDRHIYPNASAAKAAAKAKLAGMSRQTASG